MIIKKMPEGEELKGMSEKEIREWASKYDPNEKAVNSNGSTASDVEIGDTFGILAKRRKAAYAWVKEHDEKNNEPVKAEEENESAGGVAIDEKIANKMRKKTNYINKVIREISTNQSADPIGDANKASGICDEIINFITSINPEECNEEEINDLNDWSATVNGMKKFFEACKTIYSYKPKQNEIPVKQNSNTSQDVVYVQQTTPVQQTVAAHTENGFNISNFIKPEPVKGPNMPVRGKYKPLPHESCGLTYEQITQEVNKHFKLIPKEERNYTIEGCALYDLLQIKSLGQKMKEFNSKQRPNNPFLTQVDINKYIDVPDLLAKYSLCFTIPCNDKDQIIVVLFNPVPVPINNEVLQYPLHIFKARKTNNNK